MTEDIVYTRFCHCQDLWDKVYGLQGLLPARQRSAVDYTKSVKEVFLDAALIVLQDFNGPERLWVARPLCRFK
jgi:hypothetical protein